MNHRSIAAALLALGLLYWPAAARGADPVMKQAAALSARIGGGDPAEVDAAVKDLRELAVKRPAVIGPATIPALMRAGRYDDVDALARDSLIARAPDTGAVAQLTRARMRAMTALGRHDEALALAKAYYDVAPMDKTDEAIGFVAEGLANARGRDDPGVVARFKAQQVAGATAPDEPDAPAADPTDPADPTGGGADVLASVESSDDYAGALDRDYGDGFKTRVGRGNLLLLMGRPKEARAAFDLARDLAETPQETATALQAIARSIRAEDGSIGRANAFILSLRRPPA